MTRNKNKTPSSAKPDRMAYIPNYTLIPNSVFDYWMARLTTPTWLILFFFCNKTFRAAGEEYLTIRELTDSFIYSRTTIRHAIGILLNEQLIKKHEPKEFINQPYQYSLNVNFLCESTNEK